VSPPRDQGPEVAWLQARLPASGGGTPRVPPAHPRELGPLARIVALGAARISGNGPPNIFTTLGRHPRLFRAWLRYSAHLMPFGRLPRRDTELVILEVAWQSSSAYEWHQHVPIALRVGLTHDEIASVAGERATDDLTPRQHMLLAVADELLTRRAISDATWSAVQATLSEREAIELCLLVGHYQGLASAVGGLGIQVEGAAAAR
jgi:alkylhydroperoxidase family enzyme